MFPHSYFHIFQRTLFVAVPTPRCQIITCPWITAEFRYESWLLKLCFLKLGFHWNYLFSLKLSQAGRGQLMQDFVHYTQSYPSNSKRPGRFKTILIPFKSAPITSFLLLGQWLVCFSLSNRCWIWHLLCQVTSHVQLSFLLKKPFTWKKQLPKKTQIVPFFRYDATIWPHVGLARGCATSRTGARS